MAILLASCVEIVMFGPSSWQHDKDDDDDEDDEDENVNEDEDVDETEDGNEDGDAARMWHN